MTITPEAARAIAERIIHNLSHTTGVHIHGCGYEQSVSIVANEVQQTVELYVGRVAPQEVQS